MLALLELPYVQQSAGDCPHNRFSAHRSTPHKGSSSKSSQSTVSKDNSAVGEDEFLNATDGGTGVRDQGIAASGNVSTEDNAGRVELGDGNEIRFESLDAEIAEDAFDFGTSTVQESLDAVRANSDDVFGFGTSTVQESFDAIRANSADSIGAVEETAYQALQANREVTGDAFDLVDETTYQAFQFGDSALAEVGESSRTIASVLNDALGFAQTSQQAANDLSRVTNETLAMKSSDADSAVSSTLQKNLLIGMALVGLVVAFKK